MIPRRATFLAVLLLLLLALAFFWSGFNVPVVVMDEGTLLVYPELISHGKIPYRDFETFYAPGNILALTGAYSLFGFDLNVERTVGLIYRLLILGGIFHLVRRWSFTLAIGATFIAEVILMPLYLIAFAWLGGVACVFWSLLLLAGPPARWRSILAGVLAGAALLYRQDLGPAVILATLPLWLLLNTRERCWYLGGAALALCPLLIITIQAGIHPVLENLFIYPVLLGNAARRLPFDSAPDFVFCLMWFSLAGAVCNLLAGVVAVRAERFSPQARLLLAIGLFGVGISHEAWQRLDLYHVIFACFSSLALLPLGLVINLRFLRQTRPHFWQEASALALVLGTLLGLAFEPTHFFFQWASFGWIEREAVVESAGRQVVMPAGPGADDLQKILLALKKSSRVGERLFVGVPDLRLTPANDVILYHLLPWLEPASYFVEFNPLSANRADSRLATDLETADWIILNRIWGYWNEPNASMVRGPERPNEVMHSRFVCRAHFGAYALLERKDRISSEPAAGKGL